MIPARSSDGRLALVVGSPLAGKLRLFGVKRAEVDQLVEADAEALVVVLRVPLSASLVQNSEQANAECEPGWQFTRCLIRPSEHSQYPDGQLPPSQGIVAVHDWSPAGWRFPTPEQPPV